MSCLTRTQLPVQLPQQLTVTRTLLGARLYPVLPVPLGPTFSGPTGTLSTVPYRYI